MAKQCSFHISIAHRKWISLALMLVLLSGCGGTTSSATRATMTQKQLVDRIVIALEAPAKPRLLAEENLVVTLTDVAGKPVDGAQVWLGLVMPTMQHSLNEPDAVSEGQGRYTIRALFTMVGTWDIQVHATVQGQEYIAIFHAPVA
jgi:hypothetical protein